MSVCACVCVRSCVRASVCTLYMMCVHACLSARVHASEVEQASVRAAVVRYLRNFPIEPSQSVRQCVLFFRFLATSPSMTMCYIFYSKMPRVCILKCQE